MSDTRTGPGWSAAQWDLVNKAVTEAFGKANVAGRFLPCYGPLADSAEYVRRERVVREPGKPLKVEDDTTLKLFNVTVPVELSGEQVNDEGLSSALLAFRRAANILGHTEDHIIFQGYEKADGTARSLPEGVQFVRSGPLRSLGLAVPVTEQGDAEESEEELGKRKEALAMRAATRVVLPPDPGEAIVTAVVTAIGTLEKDFHPGPFACVLDDRLFDKAHTPVPGSMVLPADRITPFVNGSLFRCGRLPDNTGIVVSLGGSDIDLVVATPPKAQFLQVTDQAKYLFRVYERFRLRIKDPRAVEVL